MAEIKPQAINLKSGRTVIIRNAVPDDVFLIIEFVKAVLFESDWSVTQEHEFNMTIEKEISFIEDHIDSPEKLILVAETNGEIVGHLNFSNGVKERNRHVGIFGMSVREDWRGCGIGQALLQTLLDWARVNPMIEKVSLEVFSTNKRAQRLYHRMGFVEEGRKPREYRLSENGYVDSILMYQFT